MAEFATRKDDERCWSCKYYEPIDEVKGWCTRRPRLNQKHNDRMHRTGWCEYYEVNMDKVEDAVAGGNGQEAPPSFNSAAEEELQSLLGSLHAFDDELSSKLVAAARTDNNALMAELKGMIRAVALIVAGVEQRIATLTKKD